MLQLTTSFFYKIVNAIDILNLDYDLGLALGIGEFAGGILLTIILLFTVISLPLYKKDLKIAFMLSILVMCFGVAVAWLSIFTLIVIAFAVALGLADKLTDLFGRIK